MLLICVLFLKVEINLDQTAQGILELRSLLHMSKASLGPSVLQDTKDNFTCSGKNDSLEGLPKGIPELHRNFLQYKHCRSFPRLLTPTACEDDLFLLLAIKSTAIQVDRRMALRGTWGKQGIIEGKQVKLVFLVGQSPDTVKGYSLQKLLEYENKQFGDILQWDFLDSFFNLTLKEVHFLRWFSQECQAAQFVLKGDDDVFVHTRNLLEFLKDYSPSNHLFVGDIISPAYPIRNPADKYYIPEEMYSNREYPPYAGGGGYLMSQVTVVGLDQVAQNTDLFPIDDVYVGMCLQKMNVKLVFHNGFKTFGYRQYITPFNACFYKDLMVVHKLSTTELWTMWSILSDLRMSCNKVVYKQ
ncbi:UDP-GlcNAc:betaGal beta-1,3-N-acetylglucosaminyltransferase 4-like [Scleropages formosus]|uniref:Hexosyltransferase n=2 Tax=Scleropages formosus TaxID=113540 RepID=A0A0P7UIM8_SCLFO|nr:UDP-GlcNAc:betaGal beta-1,3-N-acetylglucosaminyltransferase 4-like [Scleropages formosus]